MKVCSRSVRGVGEKQLGLASAAVAIMHECAPKSPLGQHQSISHNRSTRTGDLPYPESILVTLAVPILNDGYAPTHTLNELHDRSQPVDMRGFPLALIARPTMHRERAHARVDDTLNELEGVFLRGQKAYLRRYSNLGRHRFTQSTEDGTEQVRISKERGAHSRVCREWLGAAAVEVEARDVVLDDLRRLDGDLWVGGAYLEDEVWLLDRVCGEDGLLLH